jgi:hypothetical protein
MPKVAERAGHRCEYCHAPEAIFNFPFEVEHIVPPRHGGKDDDINLALSCRSCNLFKADRLHVAEPQTGNTVPLFNPRRDQWQQHFRVDIPGAFVLGLTDIGRATVELLQMNSVAQLAARKQWLRLKLYP